MTYYHHDRLGSTAYLTDNVADAVASFTGYDDYCAQTIKTIIRLNQAMAEGAGTVPCPMDTAEDRRDVEPVALSLSFDLKVPILGTFKRAHHRHIRTGRTGRPFIRAAQKKLASK